MRDRLRPLLIAVAGLAVGACGDDGSATDAGMPPPGVDAGPRADAGPGGGADAGPGGGTDAGPGGAVPGGTVRGTITRTASLRMPEDGVGQLYIDFGDMCPYTEGFGTARTLVLDDVDMNDPGVRVPYEMTGLPPGTYQVWAWLDDNGDTVPSTPFPAGDPGHLSCVEVTVTATEGATADLLFDTIL